MSKPTQDITTEHICAVANRLTRPAPAIDPDESILRLIVEQHRAGLCSIEDAVRRAYGVGRERGVR